MWFNYRASPVPPSFGKILIERLILLHIGGIAQTARLHRLSLTEDGRMRPAGWERARAGSCHSAFICGAIASSSAQGLQEQTSSSHEGSEDVLQTERKSRQPCAMQEPQKYSCSQGGTAKLAGQPGPPDCPLLCLPQAPRLSRPAAG